MHFIKKKNQENKLIITCIVNILFHVQSFSSMLINQECVCVCVYVCVCGGGGLYSISCDPWADKSTHHKCTCMLFGVFQLKNLQYDVCIAKVIYNLTYLRVQ